jgi:hypothetical protein
MTAELAIMTMATGLVVFRLQAEYQSRKLTQEFKLANTRRAT